MQTEFPIVVNEGILEQSTLSGSYRSVDVKDESHLHRVHYVSFEVLLSFGFISTVGSRNEPAYSFTSGNNVILDFDVNAAGLILSATQVNSYLMVF